LKITFEGSTFNDVLDQMEDMLTSVDWGEMPAKNFLRKMSEKPKTTALPPAAQAQDPTPARAPHPVENRVDMPVENPADMPAAKPAKPERSEKQKAAAAKMRAAKEAKKAALAPPPLVMPPPPKSAEGMDPAEVAKIRVKTIEELQTAYANGFQKEVFELLARFGNGAKSFRELPVEAFVPIREAIDNGALT
jgi:hypothetical protein